MKMYENDFSQKTRKAQSKKLQLNKLEVIEKTTYCLLKYLKKCHEFSVSKLRYNSELVHGNSTEGESENTPWSSEFRH